MGHSIFYIHTPYGGWPLLQELSKYFCKQAGKIQEPSDAIFKGVGIWPSIGGVQIRKRMFQ